MASYRNYKTIYTYTEVKKAAKEKNKKYILHWLPAHKRSKGSRYAWKCVDKHSWDYWEYSFSDGNPGRWPATAPALICLSMFCLTYTYRLLLELTRLGFAGLLWLKEYFFPLAAKFNKKLLRGVQGGGFLEKSHLAAGGKTKRSKNYGIIERRNQTEGN